jgi:molybdate transport system substrate-binding protein
VPKSDGSGRSENSRDEPSADKKPPTFLLLFAAASTTDALNEIRELFQTKNRVTIRTNYAATATLAQQVVSGANADVFVSASAAWAKKLQDDGLVAERRDLLGNELVLITPAGSKIKVEALNDLVHDEVQHIALGDPESVPVGIYAKQALSKLGLWDQLRSKVVSSADVRQALTFVETGAAEAGIVYATDASISQRVQVAARVDPALSDPIRYPVLLLKSGGSTPAARQFFEFLASPESATIFRKFGFAVSE